MVQTETSRSRGLFVGLGFQKCATTQITQRLAAHPEVWPHPVRELRYWNTLFRRQRLPPQVKYLKEFSGRLLAEEAAKSGWEEDVRNLEAWTRYARAAHGGAEEYLALFGMRPPGISAWGEISPNYALMSGEEIRQVYTALDRPRLFVIMRDPVARALSQINHESRLRPQNVASTDRQLRFLQSDKVRDLADYPRVISALKALPDQKNVGFFFFEDFVGDMETFFREFCGFLGVSYHRSLVREMERSKRKTDYRSMLAPAVLDRAADLYGGMGAEVARLVGRTPASWSAVPAHP